MPHDKLLAEWFWTDRWMGSSGFLLPMEARGVYREMLTQAWRRGAQLPNDHEVIRRAIGATEREWKRAWLLIERYWRVEGDMLVNDTQREVYADAQAKYEKASERGRKGAQARAQALAQASAQAGTQAPAQAPPKHVLEHKPPSPSPSPYVVVPAEPLRGRTPPLACGLHRLKIWRWMIDAMIEQLGDQADAFDIEAWIHLCDEREKRVITGDWWSYWLPAFEAEVKKRGLPLADQPAAARMFKAPTQADADAQLELLHRADRQRDADRRS